MEAGLIGGIYILYGSDNPMTISQKIYDGFLSGVPKRLIFIHFRP